MYINIRDVRPTHFTTSAPTSSSPECQVQKQLPIISCTHKVILSVVALWWCQLCIKIQLQLVF